jgi:hypothetical protein
MPTIAPSVRAWRKIVMVVPKLSILVRVEQTYSMSGVVWVSFLPCAHDIFVHI